MTSQAPIDPDMRPERSLLSVPASSERFFAKAIASDADTIMLDLEDAVAPAEKAQARAAAIAALQGMDWGAHTICVRINGLDTEWAYRDLIDVAEACPRVDTVMVPKVERPDDVTCVATLLRGIELATGRKRPIGIEILVETALGMTNVEAIAQCSPRLESISFGPGDYAASVGNRSKIVGGPDPEYGVLTYPDDAGRRTQHWGDAWHYALARLATACRAHGIRALDGPYTDFKDPDGLAAISRRAVSLGYTGKWCIHPEQIGPVNRIFGPTGEEIAHARRLVAAMDSAHGAGAGAATLDGKMIDMAHVRQARRIIAQAEQIAARHG